MPTAAERRAATVARIQARRLEIEQIKSNLTASKGVGKPAGRNLLLREGRRTSTKSTVAISDVNKDQSNGKPNTSTLHISPLRSPSRKQPSPSLTGSKLPTSPTRSKLPTSPTRSKLPTSPTRSKLPTSPTRSKLPTSPTRSKLSLSTTRPNLPSSPLNRSKPSLTASSPSRRISTASSIALPPQSPREGQTISSHIDNPNQTTADFATTVSEHQVHGVQSMDDHSTRVQHLDPSQMEECRIVMDQVFETARQQYDKLQLPPNWCPLVARVRGLETSEVAKRLPKLASVRNEYDPDHPEQQGSVVFAVPSKGSRFTSFPVDSCHGSGAPRLGNQKNKPQLRAPGETKTSKLGNRSEMIAKAQRKLFKDIGARIWSRLLSGNDATLLVCGPRGGGKSFSVHGHKYAHRTSLGIHHDGILPWFLRSVFSLDAANSLFSVELLAFQVDSMGHLTNLQSPELFASSSRKANADLFGAPEDSEVAKLNLTDHWWQPIKSASHGDDVLQRIIQARAQLYPVSESLGCTHANGTSAHTIHAVRLVRQKGSEEEVTLEMNASSGELESISQVSFVDLAWSALPMQAGKSEHEAEFALRSLETVRLCLSAIGEKLHRKGSLSQSQSDKDAQVPSESIPQDIDEDDASKVELEGNCSPVSKFSRSNRRRRSSTTSSIGSLGERSQQVSLRSRTSMQRVSTSPSSNSPEDVLVKAAELALANCLQPYERCLPILLFCCGPADAHLDETIAALRSIKRVVATVRGWESTREKPRSRISSRKRMLKRGDLQLKSDWPRTESSRNQPTTLDHRLKHWTTWCDSLDQGGLLSYDLEHACMGFNVGNNPSIHDSADLSIPPRLLNLSSDPLLCGEICIVARVGFTVVGKHEKPASRSRRSHSTEQDIEDTNQSQRLARVRGPGVEEAHCMLINISGDVFVEPYPRCTLYVDGHRVTQRQQLHDQSRLAFGTSCLFVLQLPGKAKAVHSSQKLRFGQRTSTTKATKDRVPATVEVYFKALWELARDLLSTEASAVDPKAHQNQNANEGNTDNTTSKTSNERLGRTALNKPGARRGSISSQVSHLGITNSLQHPTAGIAAQEQATMKEELANSFAQAVRMCVEAQSVVASCIGSNASYHISFYPVLIKGRKSGGALETQLGLLGKTTQPRGARPGVSLRGASRRSEMRPQLRQGRPSSFAGTQNTPVDTTTEKSSWIGSEVWIQGILVQHQGSKSGTFPIDDKHGLSSAIPGLVKGEWAQEETEDGVDWDANYECENDQDDESSIWNTSRNPVNQAYPKRLFLSPLSEFVAVVPALHRLGVVALQEQKLLEKQRKQHQKHRTQSSDDEVSETESCQSDDSSSESDQSENLSSYASNYLGVEESVQKKLHRQAVVFSQLSALSIGSTFAAAAAGNIQQLAYGNLGENQPGFSSDTHSDTIAESDLPNGNNDIDLNEPSRLLTGISTQQQQRDTTSFDGTIETNMRQPSPVSPTHMNGMSGGVFSHTARALAQNSAVGGAFQCTPHQGQIWSNKMPDVPTWNMPQSHENECLTWSSSQLGVFQPCFQGLSSMDSTGKPPESVMSVRRRSDSSSRRGSVCTPSRRSSMSSVGRRSSAGSLPSMRRLSISSGRSQSPSRRSSLCSTNSIDDASLFVPMIANIVVSCVFDAVVPTIACRIVAWRRLRKDQRILRERKSSFLQQIEHGTSRVAELELLWKKCAKESLHYQQQAVHYEMVFRKANSQTSYFETAARNAKVDAHIARFEKTELISNLGGKVFENYPNSKVAQVLERLRDACIIQASQERLRMKPSRTRDSDNNSDDSTTMECERQVSCLEEQLRECLRETCNSRDNILLRQHSAQIDLHKVEITQLRGALAKLRIELELAEQDSTRLSEKFEEDLENLRKEHVKQLKQKEQVVRESEMDRINTAQSKLETLTAQLTRQLQRQSASNAALKAQTNKERRELNNLLHKERQKVEGNERQIQQLKTELNSLQEICASVELAWSKQLVDLTRTLNQETGFESKFGETGEFSGITGSYELCGSQAIAYKLEACLARTRWATAQVATCLANFPKCSLGFVDATVLEEYRSRVSKLTAELARHGDLEAQDSGAVHHGPESINLIVASEQSLLRKGRETVALGASLVNATMQHTNVEDIDLHNNQAKTSNCHGNTLEQPTCWSSQREKETETKDAVLEHSAAKLVTSSVSKKASNTWMSITDRVALDRQIKDSDFNLNQILNPDMNLERKHDEALPDKPEHDKRSTTRNKQSRKMDRRSSNQEKGERMVPRSHLWELKRKVAGCIGSLQANNEALASKVAALELERDDLKAQLANSQTKKQQRRRPRAMSAPVAPVQRQIHVQREEQINAKIGQVDSRTEVDNDTGALKVCEEDLHASVIETGSTEMNDSLFEGNECNTLMEQTSSLCVSQTVTDVEPETVQKIQLEFSSVKAPSKLGEPVSQGETQKSNDGQRGEPASQDGPDRAIDSLKNSDTKKTTVLGTIESNALMELDNCEDEQQLQETIVKLKDSNEELERVVQSMEDEIAEERRRADERIEAAEREIIRLQEALNATKAVDNHVPESCNSSGANGTVTTTDCAVIAKIVSDISVAMECMTLSPATVASRKKTSSKAGNSTDVPTVHLAL